MFIQFVYEYANLPKTMIFVHQLELASYIRALNFREEFLHRPSADFHRKLIATIHYIVSLLLYILIILLCSITLCPSIMEGPLLEVLYYCPCMTLYLCWTNHQLGESPGLINLIYHNLLV